MFGWVVGCGVERAATWAGPSVSGSTSESLCERCSFVSLFVYERDGWRVELKR